MGGMQGHPFGDIFGDLFGGGRRQAEDPRTPNVEIPLRVSLRQLYVGEVLEVSYSRQVVCVDAKSCEKSNNDCQGPGIKIRVQQLAPGFVQQVQVHDPSCVARGKAWKTPCKGCPNGMTEQEEIELTVNVEAGMSDGDTIKFDQVADEAVGHISGDLIFIVKQIPHHQFTRDGNNLHVAMTISLLESLVGFSKTFAHLDGHEVHIEKSDITYCSEVFVVPGEGMPIKGNTRKRGDLLITLSIDFPKAFTSSQKDLIKQALAA
jgi:DnaJ-class molecular chaperone